MRATAWEQEDDGWVATSLDIDCDNEPDIDGPEWPEWSSTHGDGDHESAIAALKRRVRFEMHSPNRAEKQMMKTTETIEKQEGCAGLRSSDLLACPFCGGQHIPEHPKMKEQWPCTSQPKLEELTEGGWRVTCYGCGVGTWNNLQYTQEQAVAAWNTRRQANNIL